jgi:hypothetical protein
MTPKPLARVRVAEAVRREAKGTAAVAVAFAGHLIAELGGEVTRALLDGVDPLASSPPRLPDGTSALDRFLNGSKRRMHGMPTAGCLITDDPDLAARWDAGCTVLIEPSSRRPPVADTELTVLAAAGLLDIFGESGSAPLALPGHQTAYAAGIAAFNAIVCAHYAEAAGQQRSMNRVSVLDVALWLNWKHFLAAYLKLPNVGLGRAEEWKTFACRDGYVAFVFQDKDLARIAALTGDPRFGQAQFATPRTRRENLAEFHRLVAQWVEARTRDEIVADARAIGLPIGPVIEIGELLGDAQMQARGFIELAAGSERFGLPRLPMLWMQPSAEAAPAEMDVVAGEVERVSR